MNNRQQIATRAMVALIEKYDGVWTKKRICDNAIAYADMMWRRFNEIPPDAQQRSEAGQHADVDWDEINRISEQL